MLASCLSRKQVFERKRRRNLNTAREGDIGPTRNDPEIGDHVWVTRDGQHPSFRYGQLVFIEEISVGAHLFLIRDFHANDSAVVGSVAIAAFTQFRDFYSDWPTFRQRVESMGSLSETGEIVVGLRLLLLRGHDLKTRYDNAAVPQPNRDVNRPICHDSEPDS